MISSFPSSDESTVTSFRNAPSVSRGGELLLARLSSFWCEFSDRFPALSDEHAFGGRNVQRQPEAETRKHFSAGYSLDEELCEGVRRGDVHDPRVDPVKVETISPRVNLLFADWELLMFIRTPLVMFFGCLERPNGPKASFVLEAQKPFFAFFLQKSQDGGGWEVFRHFAGPSDKHFLITAFPRSSWLPPFAVGLERRRGFNGTSVIFHKLYMVRGDFGAIWRVFSAKLALRASFFSR